MLIAKKVETLPTTCSVFLNDPTTAPSNFDSSDRKRIYFESKMAAHFRDKRRPIKTRAPRRGGGNCSRPPHPFSRCPLPLNAFSYTGGNKEDEAEVLLLGGGHEPQGGEEPQEALARQRRQAQGGQSVVRLERVLESVS
jgi:hypothetical protein